MTTDDDTNPDTLPDNSTRSVTLEGRNLLLVRHQGELYLYDNLCPHAQENLDPMGGSVSSDSGDLIHCQHHGAEFLVKTGECVSGPCLGEYLTPVPFTAVGGHIYLD